jgi:hypothetical protein
MNPIEHALINALLFVPLTSLPSAEVAICIDNLRSVFLGLAHLLECRDSGRSSLGKVLAHGFRGGVRIALFQAAEDAEMLS